MGRGKKRVFYAEPATKAISWKGSQSCKWITHAEKELCAQDESQGQPSLYCIECISLLWQTLTIVPPDHQEGGRERKTEIKRAMQTELRVSYFFLKCKQKSWLYSSLSHIHKFPTQHHHKWSWRKLKLRYQQFSAYQPRVKSLPIISH